MLAAIRGQPTDQIPWAPRLDLWYIAQRARGTLPERLKELNIGEVAEAFGVGCQCHRADFTQPRKPEDLLLRGLGIENHLDFPYRFELRGLPVDFQHVGNSYQSRFRTSKGEIYTNLSWSDRMRQNGITLPFVENFAVKSPDDFNAIAEIFEHIEVIPTPENYAEFNRRIGDRGLAVANG